jgi:anti-sigma factor RsiW
MHLSDLQLNEYLDQVLAPEARAEAVKHLAACVDCAARLTALQALFAQIESLPEAALSRDLAGPVVRALRQRFDNASATLRQAQRGGSARRLSAAAQRGEGLPRWVRLTASLQTALALVALALAAPILNRYVSPYVAAYKLPSLAELLVEAQTQWAAWVRSVPEFSLPPVPSLSLDLSSLALTLTAITAFLIWVVGNGLLLRRMTKSSR